MYFIFESKYNDIKNDANELSDFVDEHIKEIIQRIGCTDHIIKSSDIYDAVFDHCYKYVFINVSRLRNTTCLIMCNEYNYKVGKSGDLYKKGIVSYFVRHKESIFLWSIIYVVFIIIPLIYSYVFKSS